MANPPVEKWTWKDLGEVLATAALCLAAVRYLVTPMLDQLWLRTAARVGPALTDMILARLKEPAHKQEFKALVAELVAPEITFAVAPLALEIERQGTAIDHLPAMRDQLNIMVGYLRAKDPATWDTIAAQTKEENGHE